MTLLPYARWHVDKGRRSSKATQQKSEATLTEGAKPCGTVARVDVGAKDVLSLPTAHGYKMRHLKPRNTRRR